MTISRRTALARITALTGGALIGAEFFLSGCARPGKTAATAFTASDIALMDEIGNTIIPTTDTAGAKAVGIGAFMAMIVTDCFDDTNDAVFRAGLVTVDRISRKQHGKPFLECSARERTALLNALDREQGARAQHKEATTPPHYFRLLKDLTLLGYFTSEIGCTKALRYAETPGAYDGDVPYHKGDKAWVNPSHRAG